MQPLNCRSRRTHGKVDSHGKMTREVICCRCGSLCWTRGTRGVCDDCKNKRKPNTDTREENRYRNYEVVYDPDVENGYSVGSVFLSIEVEYMVMPQNHALTPNMVLKRGDRYYTVIQDRELKQKLVALDAPPVFA